MIMLKFLNKIFGINIIYFNEFLLYYIKYIILRFNNLCRINQIFI